MLSLTIHAAYNPTGSVPDNLQSKQSTFKCLTLHEEETIDWKKILAEDLNLRTDYDSESLSVSITFLSVFCLIIFEMNPTFIIGME